MTVFFITALSCWSPARAGESTDCLVRLLETASDAVTVGELRHQCEHLETPPAEPETVTPSVVDERLDTDRENTLQPFTLMAHKPNYFLAAAYNADGWEADLYRQQANDPSLSFRDVEAQFQISLKTPLGIGLFDTFDLWVGYTNRSFWQVYASDISAPFRETNHEPEAWIQFTPQWEILGFRNLINSFGIVHQSNGRGEVLSRSWNRVYGNFVFGRGNFAFGIKPWIRLSEPLETDDNPDISDYLGHFEWRAGYKYEGHVFAFMSRNNLESNFERGAFEFSWSFPLYRFPYLKGYVQYFYGYGESLIDYDHRVNRLGIGISLSDWL